MSAGTSVETSCASISDRIHPSSSKCREVGSFSFFRNISCVLEQEAALPASENVKTRNKRLLWPAPAKETMASRCSRRSPVGPGALIGAKRLAPSSRSAPVPHPAASAHSALVGRVPMLELRAMRAALQFLRQSAEPCGATDQSLHGFADGSSSCQGTGSLPALFVCLWLHPSCCSAKRPRALLTQDFGDQIADLPRFPQVKSLSQLGVPVDTFRDFSKEQATTEAAEQCPGLVTARDSFETVCPSRDHAPRECHRGSPAKLDEQLLVSVSQNDVPERAVQKGAAVQRFSWRYWLRALRELLTGCRTAASCCPGCRLSWKVTPARSSWRGVSLPQQLHRRQL